jgi:hypothetical protein
MQLQHALLLPHWLDHGFDNQIERQGMYQLQ